MSRHKIALVGGGAIGSTIALMTTQRVLGDVVMLDLPEHIDPVHGKALDILAVRPHFGFDVDLTSTSDYQMIEGADIVVVTAGVPRGPNMSREDVLDINIKIVKDVAAKVKKHAPDAFVILTTNPVDAIVQAFYKYSGMKKNQVVGLSGALDTSRFKNFIAMETGYSVKDVSCLVMGGHGPTMIPITRTAAVGGIPLTDLLSDERINHIVERTRHAGTEIVNLLGNGSAYFSSASAIVEMMESVVFDKKRVIASSALCEGEYGIDGHFIGVPCVLGSNGVEKIIEFKLTDHERDMVAHTLASIKSTVKEAGIVD